MPHHPPATLLPAWILTEHVCRVCFGRVLSRITATGTVVRCANCGTQLVDEPVSHLCCCGLKTAAGKDAGLRCQRNAQPTPEQPAELAVVYAAPPPAPAPTPRKPAAKAADRFPSFNWD